jgi:hypothetical protein
VKGDYGMEGKKLNSKMVLFFRRERTEFLGNDIYDSCTNLS